MYLSLQERLTAQFYNWEIRCRGWSEYNYPVDLEPPFSPFLSHHVNTRFVDDGLHPTLLQKAFSYLFNPKDQIEDEDEELNLEPFLATERESFIVLKLSFHEGFKPSKNTMEHFILMLSQSNSLLSFEIYADKNYIRYQLVCAEDDYKLLYSQLRTFYPECVIEETDDLITLSFEKPSFYCIREYGLKEEFMKPLVKSKSNDLAPLSGVLGLFNLLEEGEVGFIQVLFKSVVNPWARSILRSVQDNKGGAFFEDAPELVSEAKDKVSSPLYSSTIRIVVLSPKEKDAYTLGLLIENSLIQGTSSNGNKLFSLATRQNEESYFPDILLRQSHRTGFLLNLSELTSIVHFPLGNTPYLKIERVKSGTKKAPNSVIGNSYVLGVNNHNGVETIVSLNYEQRLRHIHLIGGTGTGKSTLLVHLIKQDIDNGEGLCVLDPHGDLIDSVLVSIPKNRIKDVVVIDPSDQSFPVAFNILKTHTDLEKDILSSDLVASFRKLSTSWGDQMNSVFSNAILAFLESEKTGTLADLRKFLVDEGYRRSFLENVTDPSIVYYWKKEFPILKSSSIGPILTRLDTFLRPKLIRHMVVQKDSLDFEKILNGNKIVLVKLSQGLIGIENSYLLGSFIVSKIHQAALGRQQMKAEVRKPYFLYIDEFQHFITPSMVSILSGARKYGLGMVLAHQDLTQIQKSEGEIYSALFSNIGTRICFRVGEQDARRLEEGFEFFTAKDLLNLGKGQAIVRSDKAENDFNITTPKPAELPDVNFKDDVIDYSRVHYATNLKEVEIALRTVFEPESPIKDPVISKREPRQEKKIVEEVDLLVNVQSEFKPEVIDILPQASNKEKTLHRYTQTLIKKMAESRGFKATIEKQLENGGRVDVSLESNGFLIGCEICYTTTKEWELHNIVKCLDAGYNIVISCSSETKILGKIKKMATESLGKDLLERIMFLDPTDLVTYLDSIISQEISTEKRIKGYRVKVNYENISDQEIKNKREAITKVVVDSIRKLNKK